MRGQIELYSLLDKLEIRFLDYSGNSYEFIKLYD